jgi:hypothetical protein
MAAGAVTKLAAPRGRSSWNGWGNARNDAAEYGRLHARLRLGMQPVRPVGRQPAPVDPKFGVQLPLWRLP